MRHLKLALSAGLMAVGLAACVSDVPTRPTSLTVTLNASQEVPPVASTAQGTGSVVLDRATRVMTYTVNYAGLTGPLQQAHFHGPAVTGKNAGVVVPITVTASPLQGRAQLTEAQAADLVGGGWYINLHTTAYPNGEIRGQVLAVR